MQAGKSCLFDCQKNGAGCPAPRENTLTRGGQSFWILPSYLDGSASNLPLQLLQQKATSLPLCLLVTEGLASRPLTGQTVLTGFAKEMPELRARTLRMKVSFFMGIGWCLMLYCRLVLSQLRLLYFQKKPLLHRKICFSPSRWLPRRFDAEEEGAREARG